MQPYYDDGTCTIYHGDSRELLLSLRADVVVTDPPYGLAFMGKAWDQVDQQFHQAWAATALQALPPGGWLLAFGGTRTWHRLACGIEDAGFEIRDTIMWLYGQGVPKDKTACLKPGWEPILLARKPGPGVLQIDACRIAHQTVNGGNLADNPHLRALIRGGPTVNPAAYASDDADWTANPAGRWPMNVTVDEEAAALLDQQSPAKGSPSRFIYTAKASRAERIKVEGEGHPTVKPLALMRWLVRLVTPPGGTVLDPFCGSGSTLVAAVMEGFRAVGVEADERWCKGTCRRLQRPAQGALL